MDKEILNKIEDITIEQENLLRFSTFSNKDALDLGRFLTDIIYAENLQMAVAIRHLNGAILYQHMTEGTSGDNQNWMQRKFNTVRLMEMSSLRMWAHSNLSNMSINDYGLCSSEYVFCGGGFPIRLETGEMVGIITVSNLPHGEDHNFIISSLAKWLGLKNVPLVEIEKN